MPDPARTAVQRKTIAVAFKRRVERAASAVLTAIMQLG
jgi:hypothetical protein